MNRETQNDMKEQGLQKLQPLWSLQLMFLQSHDFFLKQSIHDSQHGSRCSFLYSFWSSLSSLFEVSFRTVTLCESLLYFTRLSCPFLFLIHTWMISFRFYPCFSLLYLHHHHHIWRERGLKNYESRVQGEPCRELSVTLTLPKTWLESLQVKHIHVLSCRSYCIEVTTQFCVHSNLPSSSLQERRWSRFIDTSKSFPL